MTLTSIQLSKLLPYFSSKARLMSPKSISDRETMILIKVLSLVPNPAMLSCNLSAKNPTLLFTHLAVNRKE